MYGHANPTIRTTDDGEQIGPKMHSAVECVARSVYQSRNELAKIVGPNGSQQFGYRIVKRSIGKQLIKVHPEHEDANPHGQGAVVLTDKGARYLNEHADMELNPDDYVAANSHWSKVNNEWAEY